MLKIFSSRRKKRLSRRWRPAAALDRFEARNLPSVMAPASLPAVSLPTHAVHATSQTAKDPGASTNAQDTTLTVPLKLVTVGSQERLAVNVSVAGGPYLPYLLDTGSVGMYAANFNINPKSYTTTSTTFDQHYTSGIHYSGPVIRTNVSFAQGESASNVYLGLITSAKGSLVAGWQRALAQGSAPYENQFYGTLGMSLAPGEAKKQGSLYSVIAQLPGNLHTGFIIHTGGVAGKDPTLTIGLTPQNMQGFTTVPLPSAGSRGTTYAYGNGAANHVLAWNDKGATLGYQITGLPPFSAPTVFDTGEASTTLYTGGIPKSLLVNGRLESGLQFTTKLASGLAWQIVTGSHENINRVDVGASRSSGTVNTGIGLFFNYDVMYDIQDGLIGFRPISTTT
ncbi:MAG: hypothetical protein P4L84_17185 [Isosphaeraceae bacterium]|nr:hypothetical protein [Isosphaeraceae bacterium]